MTQSSSCPGCHKPVLVADQDVKSTKGPMRELRTCGRITVGKRGRLICQVIEAHAGIENLGIIDAREVLSGSTVTLGPKSSFKGDLSSPRLEISEGAKLLGGRLGVPDDPKAMSDLYIKEK